MPSDFVGIDAITTYSHSLADAELGAFNSDLAAQRKTGIQIHRVVFNWREIEGTRGHYDFGHTDRYMTGIANHGEKVLPILFDAPSFYRGPGEDPDHGIHGRPTGGKPLGKFGAALIKRYGPKGSFWNSAEMGKHRSKSAIRSWQIWNEPNLRYYWGGKPNAKQYGKVLRAAAAVMRKADKRAEIVSAGIPFSSTKRAVKPTKYIPAFFKAAGRNAVDTLGFNAYAENVKDLNNKLKLIRKALKKAHAKRTKIWITEIGWADKGKNSKSFRLVKGAKGQAREITKAIAFMGKNRKKLGLRGFVYYQWQDTTPYRPDISASLWGFHAGLLTKSGKSKPAHAAFRKAVKRL